MALGLCYPCGVPLKFLVSWTWLERDALLTSSQNNSSMVDSERLLNANLCAETYNIDL